MPSGTAFPVDDQFSLVDSSINNILNNGFANGHGIGAMATRLAILGNLFDDSTAASAEHMIRMHYAGLGVVENNTVQKVHATKEMITLRANPTANPAQKVVISDNLVKTNTYIGLQTGQANPGDISGINDIIVERNWFATQTGGGTGIRIQANEVTIRNNLITIPADANPGATVGIWLDDATVNMAAASNDRRRREPAWRDAVSGECAAPRSGIAAPPVGVGGVGGAIT